MLFQNKHYLDKAMIKINMKTNRKMVENFPQDPYSNITIITKNYRLLLVLAYLSIDSAYFQAVDPDTKQIDLTHLSEEPLYRVLKSLYGAQLESSSVEDLTQLFIVIDHLQIDDYKHNIVEEIIKSPILMDSLEMLEFSFKFNLITENFKNHHFVTQLKLLQDNRNYLQLNRISANTINTLLLEYEESVGQECFQTVNNVLENYLNRNSLSPADYFDHPQLDPLKRIWEKFHHSIQYVEKIKAEKIKNSIIFNDPKQSINFSIQQKNARIMQLQQQIQSKDRVIQRLTQENFNLKQQIKSMNIQSSTILSRGKQTGFQEYQSTSIGVDSMKRSYLAKDLPNIELSGQFQTSTIQTNFDYTKRHPGDIKQLKTMNRLNSRSKKIFK